MFRPICFVLLTLVVLGFSSHLQVDASDAPLSTRLTVSTVVRAASCTMNSSHCHCAYATPSPGQQCAKPVTGQSTRCSMDNCAGGLKCDCGAETLCEKSDVTAYTASGDTSGTDFACSSSTKTIPRVVVGRTSDVHALASQMFALIVNNDQKVQSSTGEYKVATVELHTGDVVGVIARRMGQTQYGIKVRFEDQNSKKIIMDSAWRCSENYWSAWLSSGFDADANGWTAPNESTTITGDGFDKDVPWMWLSDKETMFCRLVV